MGQIAVRQGIIIPPPGLSNLGFVNAAQLGISGTLRSSSVGFLESSELSPVENLVCPGQLGLIRQSLSALLLF